LRKRDVTQCSLISSRETGEEPDEMGRPLGKDGCRDTRRAGVEKTSKIP